VSENQKFGEPATREERRYDAQGRQMLGGGGGAGRIEDVSEDDKQKEKDRLYEEKMEDEYAKREGGA